MIFLPEKSPETKAVFPCSNPFEIIKNVHIKQNRNIHNTGCLDQRYGTCFRQASYIIQCTLLSLDSLLFISAMSHIQYVTYKYTLHLVS